MERDAGISDGASAVGMHY